MDTYPLDKEPTVGLDRLMKQVSIGVRTPSEKLSTANAGSIEPW